MIIRFFSGVKKLSIPMGDLSYASHFFYVFDRYRFFLTCLGTPCDLNVEKRSTVVNFVCDPKNDNHIFSILVQKNYKKK